MATIRIQNLGPIKDTGLIELSQIMLIIGPQSSGKSTFMKVLCYCRWLEKKIMTSFADVIPAYTHNKRFKKDLMLFHRIDDLYFREECSIEYNGEVVSIIYQGEDNNAKIVKKQDKWDDRYNSKLAYIPAERNLVSAIKNIDKTYKTNERDVLFNFIVEWGEAKEGYSKENPMPLSVTDEFAYFNDKGQDHIILPNGKIETSFYASSGIQSVAPIDVITDGFSKKVGQIRAFSQSDLVNQLMAILKVDSVAKIDVNSLSEDDMEKLREQMRYQSVQLFIEEPEQNLYPDSQRILIQNIVRRIKKANKEGKKDSMVVMTTHSPYVLSVLNVLIAEASASLKCPNNDELEKIIDASTLLPLSAYSAFFINKSGVFENIMDFELPMFSGIDLDQVSDWVDEHIYQINKVIYKD